MKLYKAGASIGDALLEVVCYPAAGERLEGGSPTGFGHRDSQSAGSLTPAPHPYGQVWLLPPSQHPGFLPYLHVQRNCGRAGGAAPTGGTYVHSFPPPLPPQLPVLGEHWRAQGTAGRKRQGGAEELASALCKPSESEEIWPRVLGRVKARGGGPRLPGKGETLTELVLPGSGGAGQWGRPPPSATPRLKPGFGKNL